MPFIGERCLGRASWITSELEAPDAKPRRREMLVRQNSTNLPAPQVQERRVQDSPRRTESDSRADGQTKRVSREVKPSTTDQPNETARSESQETSPPQQRGPTSILIWGKPMGLDAAWQEIFARRERRS